LPFEECRTPFEVLTIAFDDAREKATIPTSASPEERKLLESFYAWAARSGAAATTLKHDPALRSIEILDRIIPITQSDVQQLAQVLECRAGIEHLLLEDLEKRVRGAFDRLLELFGCLVAVPTNEFVARYLQRVAWLYIWGFDKEVYVMCRAVLDAALQDLLPEEKVNVALKRKPTRSVSLGERIHLARFSEPVLLIPPIWEMAWRVKEDGNDIVHEDVEHHLQHASPLEAIKAMVMALVTLRPPGTPVSINPPPPDADWRPTT
jgi:hypothetical protein